MVASGSEIYYWLRNDPLSWALGGLNIITGMGGSVASGRGTGSPIYNPVHPNLQEFNNGTIGNLIANWDDKTGQAAVYPVSEDATPGQAQFARAADYITDNGLPEIKNTLWIPCPLAATQASEWLPGADPFDESTLFGSAAFRCRKVESEVTGAKSSILIMHANAADASNPGRAASAAGKMDTIFSKWAELFPGTKFILVRNPNQEPLPVGTFPNWAELRANLLTIYELREIQNDTMVMDCHSVGPWAEVAREHPQTSTDGDLDGLRKLGVDIGKNVIAVKASSSTPTRVAPTIDYSFIADDGLSAQVAFTGVLREDSVQLSDFSLIGTSESITGAAVDIISSGISNSWGSRLVITFSGAVANGASIIYTKGNLKGISNGLVSSFTEIINKQSLPAVPAGDLGYWWASAGVNLAGVDLVQWDPQGDGATAMIPGATAPTFSATGYNQKAGIVLSGAANCVATADALAPSMLGDFTKVFVCSDPSLIATGDYLWSIANLTNTTEYWLSRIVDRNTFNISRRDNVGGSANWDSQVQFGAINFQVRNVFIVTFSVTTEVINVWLNGQQLAIDFSLALTPQPIGFTGYTVGALRRSTGNTGEVPVSVRADYAADFAINEIQAEAIWQSMRNG